jgi:hypothetical protein
MKHGWSDDEVLKWMNISLVVHVIIPSLIMMSEDLELVAGNVVVLGGIQGISGVFAMVLPETTKLSLKTNVKEVLLDRQLR